MRSAPRENRRAKTRRARRRRRRTADSYQHNVGILQYHSDTIASEKTPLNRTAQRGLHRRAAPLPQPAALSHGATLARRSRSAPTTWTAATAAERLVKLVSIVCRDSIVLQSIHLDGAVLVHVHELSRSLLCLPLLLSTVHNFCACWHLCSSCAINITATLIAPCFIVRRQHRRPSTSALICKPEAAATRSHAPRMKLCHVYASSRPLDSLLSLSNVRSQALDRAPATAGDTASERARSTRLESVVRPPGGLCWRMCLQ